MRVTVILCLMLQVRYAIGSLRSLDHKEPWVPRTNPIRIRQAISQFGLFSFQSFFLFHAPTHNANSKWGNYDQLVPAGHKKL